MVHPRSPPPLRPAVPQEPHNVGVKLLDAFAVLEPGWRGQERPPRLEHPPVGLLHDGKIEVGEGAVRLVGGEAQGGLPNHLQSEVPHLLCEIDGFARALVALELGHETIRGTLGDTHDVLQDLDPEVP